MLAETSNLDGRSNHASASKVDQPESAVLVSSLKSEMQQQEIQVEKVDFFLSR